MILANEMNTNIKVTSGPAIEKPGDLAAILTTLSENDVLFIDEIHLLIGAGKTQGAMDAANLLKPMLARGELHCIGATTLDEYRKYIEKDSAFERRMQKVMVDEPTVEDTISILRGLKERFESHHGVQILDSAIVAAATLSKRYISDRFLPDKAIDLIDEACAATRMQIDSMPIELDEASRKLMQLQIERVSLAKETSEASLKRLSEMDGEIKELQEKIDTLTKKWQKEKDELYKAKNAKKEGISFMKKNIFYFISMLVGSIIMVGGYFIAKAFFYGSVETAVVSIMPNVLQALVGLVIALIIVNIISKTNLIKKE